MMMHAMKLLTKLCMLTNQIPFQIECLIHVGYLDCIILLDIYLKPGLL